MKEFKKHELETWNDQEEDRLELLAITKLRGKGAPKKKREKDRGCRTTLDLESDTDEMLQSRKEGESDECASAYVQQSTIPRNICAGSFNCNRALATICPAGAGFYIMPSMRPNAPSPDLLLFHLVLAKSMLDIQAAAEIRLLDRLSTMSEGNESCPIPSSGFSVLKDDIQRSDRHEAISNATCPFNQVRVYLENKLQSRRRCPNYLRISESLPRSTISSMEDLILRSSPSHIVSCSLSHFTFFLLNLLILRSANLDA